MKRSAEEKKDLAALRKHSKRIEKLKKKVIRIPASNLNQKNTDDPV